MDLAASWKDTLADKMGLLLFCVLTCIFVFSYMLEEMSESEAAYFSIITGGYILYTEVQDAFISLVNSFIHTILYQERLSAMATLARNQTPESSRWQCTPSWR